MSESAPPISPVPPPNKLKVDTVESTEPWDYKTTAAFIRDGSISPHAKTMWGILKSYVGPSCPQPFPSLPTLSLHFGLKRKAVQKALKELETHGLLKRFYRKEHGKFHSTRYLVKAHNPKGKKTRRRPQNGLRSKPDKKAPPPQAVFGPTSIPHTDTPFTLVCKTPKPDSPSPVGQMNHEAKYHPSGCQCFEHKEKG